MPKTKAQKQTIITEISDKVKQAKSMVFVNFDKLTVLENEELRKELKKEGNEYLATKKTLLEKSLQESGFENLAVKEFTGQIATVFGFQDEISPAKILSKFAKDKKNKIFFMGGILENKFIVAEKVQELAKLPAREELYAKLVGTLNAPISGFVNALAGNLKNLVYVLDAIKSKKA